MAEKFGCYQIDHEGCTGISREEAQIISRLDSNVKLIRDTIVGPFATVETKGILRKTPNHHKRMNVVVDNLEERPCKDIAVVSQLQILKPGLDRISIVL